MEENEDLDDEPYKIDLEIQELIRNDNLIEAFDVLPTAFILTPSLHQSDMMKFKSRFSEIHMGKGLSVSENCPEKHC